jgi:tetratricopeptide (TPR) repeat protein
MPDISPLDPPGPFTVFFATSENLGLSTTLRNAADVLAESNRSVLIVNARTGGAHPKPPQPAVRQPALPHPEPGQVHRVTRSGASALAVLADDPVAGLYDHVLVEAPVPETPESARLALPVGHADSLVFCFAMTAWSIDGAAALAEDLTAGRAGRPVRLLTVGLKSDVAVHDRLREARERVRRKFIPLARALGGRDIPFLEIPYNPIYQDNRSLAVETEDAGTVTGLRPYYERLADWVRSRGDARLTDVTVVHSGRHAPWAAWLRDRLGAKGVRTELRRADTYTGERPAPGAALLFLSPDGGDEALRGHIGELSHTDVRLVLVDEPFPYTLAAHHERIDLRGAAEEEALRRLYTGLGLGAPEPGDTPAAVPFPRLPDTANVAPRNPSFTARDALFTTLDVRLPAAGRERACLVLHGPSGWGKSEAARELCHRIGPGYDIVWWVRAWERPRIERGLARLARRLGSPEDGLGGTEQAVTRLLARLSDPDSGSGSWLIVYDGVSELAELRGLLPVPHARGHVLITSRTAPDPASTPLAPDTADTTEPTLRLAALPIPPMTPEESRALLADRVAEISERQARQIGSVVDFVPHALHLAARCVAVHADVRRRGDHLSQDAALHAAVEDLFAEYRTRKTELLRTTPAVSSVKVMVHVARQVVQVTDGAAAWQSESPGHDALGWLLDAASLLTGRGIGLQLLRSRAALSELARGDATRPASPADARRPDEVQLPEEHMVSAALWALAQVGLLDVDFDRTREPVIQHHGLRDMVRADMDPAERGRIEAVLRSTLADYVPQEQQDLPADWAREVYMLRLWEDPRPRVRRSLLRHLNALGRRAETADLNRLLDIGDKARAAWSVDGDEQSPEYLRLLNFIARAHRLRGDYDRSRALAQEALRGHRRLLGLVHPRTLLSADSYAATLRSLGRFEDALLEMRPAEQGLTLLLGWKHPATMQVEHNLALTEALTGRLTEAVTRIEDRFRYRRAVAGADDPESGSTVDLLAYLYRAAGRDGEAHELLRRRLRRLGDSWSGDRLRTEVGLAVSERRLADGFPAVKDPRYGYELAHERDRRALGQYVARFGPDRLETLRCRFSYAADLHALGKFDDAVQQVRQCEQTFIERFGPGHPHSGLCQVRHGVYLRASGELRMAEEVGRAGLNLLADRLGSAHTWVAAAENSLAATVAAAGRATEAADLAHTALTRLRDLGFVHRPVGRRVRAHHDSLTGARPDRPAPPSGYDIDLELPGL